MNDVIVKVIGIVKNVVDFVVGHKMKFIVAGLILVTNISVIRISKEVVDYNKHKDIVKEMVKLTDDAQYTVNASKIVDFYFKRNVPVRFEVIKKTLKAIDRLLPIYFPEGQFTNKDFIAIVMVESYFNQYLTGKKGEKGLFQIMKESSDWMGIKKNQFDIDTNTELGMFVLNGKLKKYPNYKKAIIAYNGIVVMKNKRWNERYWKLFLKARSNVDIMFGEDSLKEIPIKKEI